MKIGKTIQVGAQPQAQGNPGTQNPTPATTANLANSSKLNFNIDLEKFSPIILFPVAIIAAIGLKFLGVLLLGQTSMGFVWKEIVSLIFAFLISAAFGSMAKKSKIATAIAILLILITASRIARHDFASERAERDRVENQKELVSNLVNDNSGIDFLLYEIGKTYVYELQAGESTPWRGFQPNKRSKFVISDEHGDYNFTIYFLDGSSYQGKPNLVIPEKTKSILRVEANSPQTLYVHVF